MTSCVNAATSFAVRALITTAIVGVCGLIRKRSMRETASIGGSKILECEINYPDGRHVDHMIRWSKENIEVPIFIQYKGHSHVDPSYHGRVRLVSQASIRISDIQMKDAGWYECTVSFLEGAAATPNGTWIYLTVNSPPVLVNVSPNHLVHKEGDTVDLFCDGRGTPQPTLTWYKDRTELHSSDQVTVSRGHIHIESLAREHGGAYTCTIGNVVGKVSHVIKLVVEGSVYIMRPPMNLTIRVGHQARLPCHSEGSPNNITYQWFRNGVDIQRVGGGLMERAGVFGDGSFVITSVEKTDMAVYTCRPSNGLSPPPEASAFLNVTYLPMVQSMEAVYYLPLGMTAHLPCPVDANPPVNYAVWNKNNQVIDLKRSSRLMPGRAWSLVFRNVSESDAGSYSCWPYSSIGAGLKSRLFKVLIKDPPHFVVRPLAFYQKQPGQTVTMWCEADGQPTPKISWRKSDGSFPKERNIYQEGGNLTIVDLQEADAGMYECVATNRVTQVVTVTRLIMEGITSHAARNMSVESGQFWARLSWLPAYSSGHTLHYVIWFRMVKNGKASNWQTLRIHHATATCYTVYNLFPGATYQFTLLSRDNRGHALYSKVVTVTTIDLFPNQTTTEVVTRPTTPATTTPPGPPPFPPCNLTVDVVNGGLEIRWQPPRNRSIPVHYYVIEYRTVGPWLRLNGDVKGGTSFFWRNPSMGVDYTFRILAGSRSSASRPSESVFVPFKNPNKQSKHVNRAVVGGVMAGLVFLFLVSILSLIAVKLLNRKRKREQTARYGNVKYFDPNHVNEKKKKPAKVDGQRDRNSRSLAKHKRLSMEMAEQIL